MQIELAFWCCAVGALVVFFYEDDMCKSDEVRLNLISLGLMQLIAALISPQNPNLTSYQGREKYIHAYYY